MPRPLPVAQVTPIAEAERQNLAAPDRPVGAVPGAVEGGDDRRPLGDAVFCQQRQRVRVVVLDAEQPHPRALVLPLVRVPLRPSGRRVVRVQIVDDDGRFHAPHPQHPLDGPPEGRLRHGRPHVTDVRRHVRHPVVDHGERVLQFTADCEDVGGGVAVVKLGWQGKRQRRDAARPPDGTDAEENGILHRHVDAAIVQHERVRDVAQPLAGRRVVVAQGLAGRVAGRGHQGLADEQFVQRRIRQHHADIAQLGGDRRGEAGAGAKRRDDDRAGRRGQQRQLGVVDGGQSPGGVDVGDHHREGLGRTMLAAAQLGDGGLVRGIAHQMETADALHRQDGAVVEQSPGADDRRAHESGGTLRDGGPAALLQPQPRTAVETADRLRVMTPVARVRVLCGARRTHGELPHRGVRTVVGDVLDDGQPRPAVDARDEGVTEAPVARIVHLRQALRTRGHVRRQQRAGAVDPPRRENAETGFAIPDGQVALHVRQDAGQRRGVVKHLRDEGVDLRRLPLDLDEHFAIVVAAEPADAMPGGDGGDVRAEPHALDHAAQQVFAPDFGHDASLTVGARLDADPGHGWWTLAPTTGCGASPPSVIEVDRHGFADVPKLTFPFPQVVGGGVSLGYT